MSVNARCASSIAKSERAPNTIVVTIYFRRLVMSSLPFRNLQCGAPLVPLCGFFVGVPHQQHAGLVEGPAEDLQPDRQTLLVEAAWRRERRHPNAFKRAFGSLFQSCIYFVNSY